MWNSGWHTTPLSRLLRSDIIIFIKRCQKPVSMKFIGLPNLELETFSSVGVSFVYQYNKVILILTKYLQCNASYQNIH